MILHHYPLSPFAEKCRLMLGYSGIKWQSVLTSPMPPRPVVDALAGGYRRIPVAQIGADIFCDSRLIAEEIAELAGKPELSTKEITDTQIRFIDYAEKQVFFAAIGSLPPNRMMKVLLTHLSPLQAMRFVWDRLGIARETASQGDKPSARQFRRYLKTLDQQLQYPFFFGNTVQHADFALYHALWFVVEVGQQPLPPQLQRLCSWYQRMHQFSHGQTSNISGKDALAMASASQPRVIPASHAVDPLVGKSVSLAPTDYARDEVKGVLVGSSRHRWIVKRNSDKYGTLHVHFPKQGYQLKELD
ncbi:Glutathione S-transferase [Ferrimonas sediminum]|uniref:Glutathione S-transferase n=1 Tax=Ferrimonas sediminum TaxID=718193 RepID=A0A1G8VMG1_9GAMM|nr:glutathione S-transferase family protein [Ferrimonas sediminum]SDJ67246.1 Glutathione S-transferase [Ferrimonas sediminum]